MYIVVNIVLSHIVILLVTLYEQSNGKIFQD